MASWEMGPTIVLLDEYIPEILSNLYSYLLKRYNILILVLGL